MFLKRFLKAKFLAASCLMVLIFFLIKSNGNGKITMLKSTVMSALSMSKEEFAEFARVDTCPACFGRDLCPELDMFDVSRTLFRPGASPGIPPVHPVYNSDGEPRYWLNSPANSDPRWSRVAEDFDKFVCRNGSGDIGGDYADADAAPCQLSAAAQNSFLYTSVGDISLLRQLARFGGNVADKILPMAVCPSMKMVQGLMKAFDEDDDDTLTGFEKSLALFTLVTRPDLAARRFIRRRLQVPVPALQVYGACGRVYAVEGDYRPLAGFLDEPLEVRKDLATQLLRLIESFLEEDAHFSLFLAGDSVHMDNLVVTRAGQLVFRDLSRLMILDREFLGEEYDDKDEEDKDDNCEHVCLEQFYQELLEGEDTVNCYKVRPFLEYSYAQACRNVLSDMYLERNLRQGVSGSAKSDTRGLLHSIQVEDESVEVNNLLRECIDETEKGGRLEAVMSLMEIFSADFEDEGEEEVGGEVGKVGIEVGKVGGEVGKVGSNFGEVGSDLGEEETGEEEVGGEVGKVGSEVGKVGSNFGEVGSDLGEEETGDELGSVVGIDFGE